MVKDLKIITLESIDGIGISTQVRFLNKQLTQLGYKVKSFKFGDIEKALRQVHDMQEFLYNNDSGIIVNDGSFTKSIANDMLNGYSRDKLEEKYRDILYRYECLNHKYSLLNIILLPENAEMGQKRRIKNAKVLGKKYEVIKDLNKQRDVLKLLNQLNNHTITRSIEFDMLNIYEDDKILEINSMIWKLLKNFDIKKPS